jgi:hypothetical protein
MKNKMTRYNLKDLSIDNLKNIMVNDLNILILVVFVIEGVETRYKVTIPKNDNDFLSLVRDNLSINVDGIDSGDYVFLECDYIDIYTKYPM